MLRRRIPGINARISVLAVDEARKAAGAKEESFVRISIDLTPDVEAWLDAVERSLPPT